MTLSYCKTRFIAVMTLIISSALGSTLIGLSSFFFPFNEFHMPFRFYIELLPINEFSNDHVDPYHGAFIWFHTINWIVNFTIQLVMLVFNSTFYFIYIVATLLLIDNICSVNVLSWVSLFACLCTRFLLLKLVQFSHTSDSWSFSSNSYAGLEFE